MRKAAEFLDKMEIPFEINALSAHRTPQLVEKFASNAHANGIRVIIAGAGGAAHLPGVVAALLPFLLLACLAVRPSPLTVGIPFFPYTDASRYSVATVGLDAAHNAGILAAQMLATGDEALHAEMDGI